jgi:hypothetical protein
VKVIAASVPETSCPCVAPNTPAGTVNATNKMNVRNVTSPFFLMEHPPLKFVPNYGLFNAYIILCTYSGQEILL